MKATLLCDQEYRTETFEQLQECVSGFLSDQRTEVKEFTLGRENLAFCMGCFGCWVKTPGECVIKDKMTEINECFINSDVVIYLCPVVFGQYSANMKNAIDRWLPNILPFFKKRTDGSTIHPTRYKNNPKQIMIAYAEELTEEDADIFMDISKKHRHAAEVIIYRNSPEKLREKLQHISLKKVGAVL
jgi:multimeric flavodoxin WrbA